MSAKPGQRSKAPWWALGGAAAFLAIALAAAGYAIGAGSAPDEGDALAAQARARAATYVPARARAAAPEFKVAFAEARPAGLALGRSVGARRGRRAGERDAAVAAQRERDRIASQLADCPDFTDSNSLPAFDISVRGIDCSVGSGLIREFSSSASCGSGCTLSNGWQCTLTSTGYESWQVRCTDGLRAVRWNSGS